MADREKEWIGRLAEAKTVGGDRQYIIVQRGHGRVEVAMRSEPEPLLRIGDWAIVTLSPRQFVIWSEMFKAIIAHAQRKHKPSSGQEYSADTFFGKYESLVREQIGQQLDDFNKLLRDIGHECSAKLMNMPSSDKVVTANDLLAGGSAERRQIVSTLIYDDALWRFEAAHLMISIGLLNIAYANLRESLEALINAFIVERVDEEAIKFLKGDKVNQKLIAKYINKDYNQWLKNMKGAFSNWGVHTKFESVQLTSLFGPARFDKIVAGVPKVNRPLKLRDGFVDAASKCIDQAGNLGILFIWLMKMPRFLVELQGLCK